MPHFAWALPQYIKTHLHFPPRNTSWIHSQWCPESRHVCSPAELIQYFSFLLKSHLLYILRLFISKTSPFTDTIHNSRTKFFSKNFATHEVRSISQNIQVRQPPGQAASSILLHMPVQVQRRKSDTQGCHNSFKISENEICEHSNKARPL